MKLDLKGIRINRCVFENKMGPNTKLNLKVDTRTQISVPKEFKKGSMGTVSIKMVVGTPLEGIYLFLEQVATFIDSDATENMSADQETMMSLFKTICVPMAMAEMEKTISQICAAYHIPEIKLQRNPNATSGKPLMN